MTRLHTVLLAVSCLAGGFLLGSEERPRPTELQAAQFLSGDKNVRLVGFFCGDHALTALAREEDEFPERGCKEIRELKAE